MVQEKKKKDYLFIVTPCET